MSITHSLRVVIASPGDVTAERDAAAEAVEHLASTTAAHFDIALRCVRWETDAYPGFHEGGAQSVVDEALRVDECDVLVGIFWRRFGTPTREAASGTEKEIRDAVNAWRLRGRPRIMLYFCDRPAPTPRTREEIDQLSSIVAFKDEFRDLGLWWTYTEVSEFQRLLTEHLGRHIARYVLSEERTHSLITSVERLRDTNIEIVREASSVLFCTGSRSRDVEYLEVIEDALETKGKLVHFRVLFGPPHKSVLRDHLGRLLRLRSPEERLTGRKTINIGMYTNLYRQFEANIVGNERRALIVLPSFSGLGEYDSGVLVESEPAGGLLGFVRELYAASHKLETQEAVEALELLPRDAS